MTHAEAGRIGGRRTLAKHGRVHFIRLSLEHSHKGGRPRAKTMDDIRAQAPKIEKEARLPTGFRSMLQALRYKENLAKGGLKIARKTLGYDLVDEIMRGGEWNRGETGSLVNANT